MESVWIKVRHRNESLALGVMYRPPASKNNYFNNILDQLDNVFSLNEKNVLIGDLSFNYKFDETLSCNPLHQIEILYNMRQLITVPTRVTLNTSTAPVRAAFYVRFLPRKAVRKMSVVFDIFCLARQNLSVCAGRELLAELRKFELCR